MNVGILVLGLIGGAIVGTGLFVQSTRAHRRRADIGRRGVTCTGTVVAVRVTGRFAEWRQVDLSTPGGHQFTTTVPAALTTQLGLTVGASVEVTVVPGEPHLGQLTQAAAAPHGRGVAVASGLFIAALGVAAALVT